MTREPDSASYYRDDAFVVATPVDELRLLEPFGVRHLSRDQERGVRFVPLFDLFEDKHTSQALPNARHPCLILPGSRDEHEHIVVDGVNLRTAIEQHINARLKGRKFFFYTRTSVFYAFELSSFSYEIMYRLCSGHDVSSFVVFGEGQELQICFDNDLEVTLITADLGKAADEHLTLIGKGMAFWNDFFNQNFTRMIFPHQAHIDFINEHYVPRLPGIAVQTFPPGTKVVDYRT